MPVGDESLYLYDGNAAADAHGEGVGIGPVIYAGAAPIDGMLLRFNGDASGSGTWEILQSDDPAFGTSASLEEGGTGSTPVSSTPLTRILWTMKYLQLTFTTGAGIVNVSLVQGRQPDPTEVAA